MSAFAATGVAAAPASTAWRRRLRDAIPPAVVFVAFVLLWEFSLSALGVQQFLLPRPSVIVGALAAQQAVLVKGAVYTGTEVVGGLVIGSIAAFTAALITSRWSSARESILPVAIAANSIPIIALAPITNIWFGSTEQLSRMVIVAILVFFPMMVNTVRGLTQVEPSSIELMRASAASDWQILTKVRVPNALPFVLTGLKVATTLAVIGAVVGEYFGGPQYALGVFIKSEAYVFRYSNAWAAILIASLMGIGFYLLVLGLERILIPWHSSGRRTQA